MRILPRLFLLCLALTGYSQDSNSLLWEISGNGLEQPSYLYGTMHVSKKIAFLLDDVFYEALDQSEVVALESDPATWLENDTDNSNIGYGFNPKGFYTTAFTMQSPGKKDLAAFLASDDDLVNNILYRTSDYNQNFEEETYLDMFIYQAGSKFGKPILALEDLEESQALVGRASMNAMKRKPDEWLQQKMERNDLMSLMQDAYRERNINLLDSIDRAMYTDHYLNNMLYIRNENMAKRLDSAIRKTKVFAGIGAAHLPGEKGVIALLENLGYTVLPLISEATKEGSQLKEKFVQSFRKPELSPQSPEDGFFSIGLPYKLYPVAEGQHTTYISPDLTNGSYLMVHRIPTFSYLNRKATYTIAGLEGLLFENIPGKILERKRISRQGFEGLDIRNQLKNGNHQHYQIYITPLEILIFKMGGQGNYTAEYSGSVFNTLKFKSLREGRTPIVSAFEDFEVEFPAYYSFTNRERNGNRCLQGYSPAKESYYFLKQATLNDFDFIEKDSFELKQIQDRFYRRLELEPVYNTPGSFSLTSSAAFDGADVKRLYLKTEVRKGDYYLLGVLTGDPAEAASYFNSFRINETRYHEGFTSIRDTAMYFSTISPVSPNKFVETSIGHYKTRKELKSYHPYSKKTIYQHANNEAILVTLSKSHDYMTFPGIDSVWALRKKQYAGASFRIHKADAKSYDRGYHELQLILTDTASSRAVLVKNVLKGGLLYELKANVDTIYRPSSFVTKFFDNFRPMDTLIGRDLLEDKTPDFFKALRENDSIVIKGYRYLLFDERHADSLMHYVATYDFSGDKEHIQSHMLKELGAMELQRVREFLKKYYSLSYANSGAQTRILQAATLKGDQASAERLLSLLATDLPLVANPVEIDLIFAPYYDNLPLAADLFPEILEYSAIPEYKEPVISLLATLYSHGEIKPKRYKKYMDPLVNDANMQLKRQLGLESQSRIQNVSFNKNNRQQKKLLEDYTSLLFPFRKDRAVTPFFTRMWQVKDPGVRTTYMALLASEGIYIPQGIIDSLASDINSRKLFFNKLHAVDKVSLFPEKYATLQMLAEAALFEGDRFDPSIDTIRFIGEQLLQYEGRDYKGFYFKHKNQLDFNKNFKMYLLVYPVDALPGEDVYYKSKGLRMADTDTEVEVMRFVTEEFHLKDHPRAVVFEPEEKIGYHF
jgi:uncharacterized protein YbaP (TraB family)